MDWILAARIAAIHAGILAAVRLGWVDRQAARLADHRGASPLDAGQGR